MLDADQGHQARQRRIGQRARQLAQRRPDLRVQPQRLAARHRRDASLGAERREPDHAEALGEFAGYEIQCHARIADRAMPEDVHQRGERVLGVHVDLPGALRAVAVHGVVEAERALDGQVGAPLELLGDHLTQDPLLRRRRRADDDAVGPPATRRDEQEQSEDRPASRHGPQ